MVSVRLALALLLSQCAWPVRAALWRCRTEPRRAAFPKGRAESENGSRRDLKGKGGPGGWKGVQEGNAVSHSAPAFPRLEDSPLEKLKRLSASTPGASLHDTRL